MIKTIATTLMLAIGGVTLAAPPPTAEPEEVGMSSARLEQIRNFTQQFVDQGRQSGFVTLVARRGQIVHFDAVGSYGVDNDKAMSKDALFRIYSMTKPITNVAALILYEEGKFQLADPVAWYLPEFENQQIWRDGELVAPSSAMTIEQLMTHTAGLTSGFTDNHPVEVAYREAKLRESRDLDEFVGKLAALPLRFEPGSRYHYGPATDVLGAVVERISGQTLEAFFKSRIFEPLEMHDTFFNVPTEKLDRLATIHVWDNEAEALAVGPPQVFPSPTNVTLFSGGGGLISSAMDYLVFCEMLRRGGSYEGVRILGPKTVQYMMMDRLIPSVRNRGAAEFPAFHLYPGQSAALGGGVITDPSQSQVTSSKGEYSWGGIGNTKFWIDPEEDLVAILMTQLVSAPWSDATRYRMKVATYQALTRLGSD